MRELAVAFLDHLKTRTDDINYITYRIIIDEFLLELYADTPAEKFSTTCLDLVKRANRKTKISPSQAARYAAQVSKPKSRVGECYNPKSYYRMVERLIARANKAGEDIPAWFPYMIRHSTATADAMDAILKQAMERQGHTKSKMTENYAQVKGILENMLALTQDNPFAV